MTFYNELERCCTCTERRLTSKRQQILQADSPCMGNEILAPAQATEIRAVPGESSRWAAGGSLFTHGPSGSLKSLSQIRIASKPTIYTCFLSRGTLSAIASNESKAEGPSPLHHRLCLERCRTNVGLSSWTRSRPCNRFISTTSKRSMWSRSLSLFKS